MRTKSGSAIIWFLFAIIIAAFVLFFGPQTNSGSLGCGTSKEFAMQVNDEEVSVNSWRYAYNGLPLLLGTNVPGNQRRPMALEFLLQREILAQAAEEYGFMVSGKLLDEHIANGDFILLGNKLDGTKIYFEDSEEAGFFFNYDYLTNLARGRLGLPSLTALRKEQRRELLAYYVKKELVETAVVSEEEARANFVNANTTVSAEYVKFDVARYRRAITLSESDVAEYAADNEESLKNEWEQVKPRWESDAPRLRARVIRVAKQKDATPAEGSEGEEAAPATADEGKTKIEGALARIKGGEDFAVVAKELSEDKSATLGGSIGWRSVDSLGYGQEVVEGVKDLEAGKVSEIIETPQGYVLVKVEERSDKGLSFEQKKMDLAVKAAPDYLAKKRAKAAAEAALALAKTTPLNELFEPAPMGAPSGLDGLPPELLEQLNQQQIQDLQKQLESQGSKAPETGAIIEETPTRLARLDDQGEAPEAAPKAGGAPAVPAKPKAVAKPKVAAEPTAAKPVAKEAPAAGAGEATPALPDDGVDKPNLGYLAGASRNGDFLAGIGRSKDLAAALFGELGAGTLAPQVYEVSESDGYVIVRLTARTEADMERFNEEKAGLMAALAESKGNRIFADFVSRRCEKLKKSGDIVTNTSLLVVDDSGKPLPYEPCSYLNQGP